MPDPNYDIRTLLEPYKAGPLLHTFLRDTFFTDRQFPASDLVEFDFQRGRRKMAPFVAPMVGGKIMERQGFQTRFYKVPRVAPARAMRLADLEPRMMGETIYSDRSQTDRAAELLADDGIFCDEAISRREEWMCREVLINGLITVTADDNYTYAIDFTEGTPNVNVETPLALWNLPASDPLLDLENARRNTIQASGISPNIALMGTDASDAFIRNASVQAFFDNRRMQLGAITPVIQDAAVTHIGNVPGLEIYTYSEWFEDDAGTLFEMLPANMVLVADTRTPNKMIYGAYSQLEDPVAKVYRSYRAARIPLVYADVMNSQLWYRLTSLPMPMPTDILGWRRMTVL
jgi:Phage major capsid protein E